MTAPVIGARTPLVPVIDASTPAERANVQRVLDFYATAVNRRDAAAVADFVTDDFVQHNPLYGTGREGVERFLTGPLMTAFPDFTVEVELAIAQQDRVLVYLFWRGHHGRTGEEVELGTADLYRLRDGKLAEHWDIVEYQEIEPFGFPRPQQAQPDTEPLWTGTEAQRTNMGLLHRYTTEVTVQDYSRAHLYIRKDFLQNDPMIPPGLDGFKACCEIFRALAPDMHVVVHHLIVGSVYLGAIWDWTGLQDKTDLPVEVPTSDIYRLQDGLLAEHWDRADYTFVKRLYGHHPKQPITGGR
jgi:predicted SnoaL-like aldol condensation-catalyzing enzyme